ncbi:MAG: RsmE family RNA methyltransferase [Phycisphaerales bacterium]|jgi:16S rRNA (uracil1498-N3)-methyltransferase
MHINRFYCEKIAEPITEAAGEEAHHIASVMRHTENQTVELFDGKGTLAQARIESASSKKVICRIEQLQTIDKPNRPRIIIAASIPKGERLDLMIKKCTELGVDRITPVIFERTVKQPKNPKAKQRWLHLAIAAAKQCHRIFLPEIDTPLTLTEAIEKLTGDHPKAEIFAGRVTEKSASLIDYELADNDVIAFIGPEGGMSPQEQLLLNDNGAKTVRLNENILRIETAAIAFASVLTARRSF